MALKANLVKELMDLQILHSSIFHYGILLETDNSNNGEVKHELMTDGKLAVLHSTEFHIKKVVEQIKAEFDFNCTVSNAELFSSSDASHNLQLETETQGIIALKVSTLEKIVLWHTFCGCLYILICDKTENRILASGILIQLIRSILDHIPAIKTSTSEIVTKSDVISTIVNTLLPHGQLLFIHNRAMQHLTKEVDKIVRS